MAKIRLSRANSLILASLGVFALIVPISADAGIKKTSIQNFVVEQMARARVAAETSLDRGVNSQTMAVLQAVGSPNPELARGGGDISIIEGTSLLPESGPLGTAADIEEGVPSAGNISIYVVRKGDTVGDIAKMFNVSANTIRWANDLSKDSALKEGSTLLILPVTGIRHVVARGDTIVSIAKKHGADVNDISRFNGIAMEDKLEVGETIIVPNGELELVKQPTNVKNPIKMPNLPSIKGYFANPIPGAVKTQGIHGWNGVDLASYPGASVLAAANGVVIVSREGGWNGGYGNYIVIAHPNGTQTLYGHLSSNSVSAGETVRQGELIGREGSTGRSTGPHLHFEVRGAKNPF